MPLGRAQRSRPHMFRHGGRNVNVLVPARCASSDIVAEPSIVRTASRCRNVDTARRSCRISCAAERVASEGCACERPAPLLRSARPGAWVETCVRRSPVTHSIDVSTARGGYPGRAPVASVVMARGARSKRTAIGIDVARGGGDRIPRRSESKKHALACQSISKK